MYIPKKHKNIYVFPLRYTSKSSSNKSVTKNLFMQQPFQILEEAIFTTFTIHRFYLKINKTTKTEIQTSVNV